MGIEEYLAERGYRGTTLEHYRYTLQMFEAAFPHLEEITALSFRDWLESHGWGHNMIRVTYMACRGYLRWKLGEDHPAIKLKIKREPTAPQRFLKMQQVQQLLALFDTTTPKGIRDLAICSLMLDSGLRVSEICHLEIRYLDLEERRLQVIIKGGKWGEGIFGNETAVYLANWLKVREKIAKPATRTVFCGVGGNTPGMPLTRNGLKTLFYYWGEALGIGAFSPHDLRRTFAVIATRLHAPSRVLQVAGRWSDIKMVERYTAGITADDFEDYFPVSGAMRFTPKKK